MNNENDENFDKKLMIMAIVTIIIIIINDI